MSFNWSDWKWLKTFISQVEVEYKVKKWLKSLTFQEEVEYKVEAVDDGLVISIQVIRTIMTLFLPESTFCILSHCIVCCAGEQVYSETEWVEIMWQNVKYSNRIVLHITGRFSSSSLLYLRPHFLSTRIRICSCTPSQTPCFASLNIATISKMVG